MSAFLQLPGRYPGPYQRFFTASFFCPSKKSWRCWETTLTTPRTTPLGGFRQIFRSEMSNSSFVFLLGILNPYDVKLRHLPTTSKFKPCRRKFFKTSSVRNGAVAWDKMILVDRIPTKKTWNDNKKPPSRFTRTRQLHTIPPLPT